MNEETPEDIAMRKRTGGPAFPWDGMGDDGMTLRDYFAAAALTAAAADEQQHPTFDEATYKGTAMRAYLYADAMLKERSK